MSRLFIGVYPPPDVVDQLRSLPREEMSGVRWVPEEQWHITLRFLGNADEGEAVAAFDDLGGHPEVIAELGPHISRLGRDVVCIPAGGLSSLAAHVARVTADVGEPVDPRPFAGHLTLARIRGRGTCGLAGERFEASFPVGELVLVRSTLGPTGARHEQLASRPVAG